jgi:hypothetical protein
MEQRNRENRAEEIKKETIRWMTSEADMRYFADAADAVCVKNSKLCVKFMLEFTGLTRNVTILRENRYLIHPCW